MPNEPERCARHPAAATIGACDGCGETLCLTCAVPVRGRVLGPSCLVAELGPDAVPQSLGPPAPDPLRRVVDIGLAVAFLSTALPWSGVGLGASPFGAWGFDLRWASLAAAASLLGTAAAAAARLAGRRHARPSDRAAAAAALGALAGAVVSIVMPPPYTSPAPGPWVAAGAAIVAAIASLNVMRREVAGA